MKHIVTLDRNDIQLAISEYLLKNGYVLNKKLPYGSPLEFTIGRIDVGTQREPMEIDTVVSVTCILER